MKWWWTREVVLVVNLVFMEGVFWERGVFQVERSFVLCVEVRQAMK